jgi:uncharacterized NAD(P)/FAD-binding protein YdhS
MTSAYSVAIIGLGSRGVGVLERLVSLARLGAAPPIRVEVIDPACDGAGVHAPGQPDYLLLNTTCGQVSMFPDAATVGADVDQPGPNLYDWVTDRGLRLGADGFTVGQTGREIRPQDFLPRRVLGEYLRWCVEELTRRAAGYLDIRLHRAEAVDISSTPVGELTVWLSEGNPLPCRYAFVTTGYTANTATARQAGFIDRPYPLPDQVDRVGPGQTVAINGFGLSAMDVMSSFTVGRGGRFTGPPEQLTYQPSGQEPLMLMFSRSGVPCRARPLVMDFDVKYQPLVFTQARIDSLREERDGPLDFEADLLPLIHTELLVSYRRRLARQAGREDETVARFKSAGDTELAALLAQGEPFDPAAMLRGDTDIQLDGTDAYQKWFADVISRDLAEAVLGFIGSPLKGAIDVLRDQRDMFRYATDFDGLTDESLEHFHRSVVPQVNRAVVGPQFERHSEMLALMAAGLLQTPFGPAPTAEWDDATKQWTISSTQLSVPTTRTADWLLAAHVTLPSVEASASPLIAALHRRGWIRPRLAGSKHVLGIDIDRDQHPRKATGGIEPRLWVLGPLCEGSTFYNNLVPSPGAFSRPAFDSHRCVKDMLAVAEAATASG